VTCLAVEDEDVTVTKVDELLKEADEEMVTGPWIVLLLASEL
jgi:hypothetical protein